MSEVDETISASDLAELKERITAPVRPEKSSILAPCKCGNNQYRYDKGYGVFACPECGDVYVFGG